MKTIVLLMVVLALTGCFGGGVIYSSSEELTNYTLRSYGDKVGIESRTGNPDKNKVLEMWGMPNKIYNDNGLEVWKYDNGYNWVGIVPMFVIGVPIALPLIPSNTFVYFDGNHSVKIYFSRTEWAGGCYCPENEGAFKYGFHALK